MSLYFSKKFDFIIAAVAKAIGEMIATDGPFLLEACVEEEGNVMPMTPPGGSVNQMLLEC